GVRGGGGASGGTEDAGGGFAPPMPAGQPTALRPAKLGGSDETVIYVECRTDVVIVYPARKQIALDSLGHTAPHNPLTQTVNQIIARQQALAKAGGSPARFLIRFLVHPNSELTYHRAYP